MPYTVTLSRKKLDIPEATISKPVDVHDFARKHVLKKKDSWRESCHLLTVDRNNNVRGIFLMSLGTEHNTTVDAGLAARVAVMDGAPAVILIHNHPGENPSPSNSDIEMLCVKTSPKAEACNIVGLDGANIVYNTATDGKAIISEMDLYFVVTIVGKN